MQATTSDPHAAPPPPEGTLNAITTRRDVAQRVRRSGCSRDRGPRVWQIGLRFGNDHRWRWVIALALVAVSTMVAAIAVLANLVVLIYTVEMTKSLALQAVMALAIAGTLTQISLFSFMFAWEKSQPLP